MPNIPNERSKKKRPIIQFIKCPECGYSTSTVSFGEVPQKSCPNCKTIMEPIPVPNVNRGPIPSIDPLLCVGCGKCQNVCPMGAIEINDKVAMIMDERCIGCKNCIPVCPFTAISIPK